MVSLRVGSENAIFMASRKCIFLYGMDIFETYMQQNCIFDTPIYKNGIFRPPHTKNCIFEIHIYKERYFWDPHLQKMRFRNPITIM